MEYRMRALIFGIVGSAMLFLTVGTANALTVESYRHPKNDVERNLNKVTLLGVMDGLLTYNTFVKARDGAPLYCQPQKLSITFEQAESIMFALGRGAGKDPRFDNRDINWD